MIDALKRAHLSAQSGAGALVAGDFRPKHLEGNVESGRVGCAVDDPHAAATDALVNGVSGVDEHFTKVRFVETGAALGCARAEVAT